MGMATLYSILKNSGKEVRLLCTYITRSENKCLFANVCPDTLLFSGNKTTLYRQLPIPSAIKWPRRRFLQQQATRGPTNRGRAHLHFSVVNSDKLAAASRTGVIRRHYRHLCGYFMKTAAMAVSAVGRNIVAINFDTHTHSHSPWESEKLQEKRTRRTCELSRTSRINMERQRSCTGVS